MPEISCQTSCDMYRVCKNGDVDRYNEVKLGQDLRLHNNADVPQETREFRIVTSVLDRDDVSYASKRIVSIADNGRCEGPSRKQKCELAYAVTIRNVLRDYF